MKNSFFICICVVCLAAGGSFAAYAQSGINAERMVVGGRVADQDTVPGTAGMKFSEDSALEAADVPVLETAEQADTEIPSGEPYVSPGASDLEGTGRVQRIWEEIDNSTATTNNPADLKRISPWSFSTSAGTSFISFPGFGSAMNMYAAPRVNFAATERLGFHAGVSVGRTLPVIGSDAGENLGNTGMTNISTFVAASYLLTDNLVLHGTGSRSAFLVPVNGELQSVQFNDISIGATYNFGNFSIGATIHHSDAPQFGSPFGRGNSMYGAPLFW